MRALFKRPAPIAEIHAPAPAPGADRSRLKAALASRQQAIEALAAARATIARLGQIVRISDDAAHDAEAAQRAEKEFRADWARSGCQPFPCTELDALAELAVQKAQAAQGAAANAATAAKEIDAAEEGMRRSQSEFESLELEIAAAIGAILVAEAATVLERLARCAAEYKTLRLEAVALMKLVTPAKFGVGSANQNAVERALNGAFIKPFDHFSFAALGAARETLDALSAPWRERASKLRTDPDS